MKSFSLLSLQTFLSSSSWPLEEDHDRLKREPLLSQQHHREGVVQEDKDYDDVATAVSLDLTKIARENRGNRDQQDTSTNKSWNRIFRLWFVLFVQMLALTLVLVRQFSIQLQHLSNDDDDHHHDLFLATVDLTQDWIPDALFVWYGINTSFFFGSIVLYVTPSSCHHHDNINIMFRFLVTWLLRAQNVCLLSVFCLLAACYYWNCRMMDNPL